MLSNLAKGAVRQALEGFYTHSPAAVVKFNDIVAKNGQGSWVWTSDGEKYLDFSSGIGVTSTGHCHPDVVRAVQAQAAEIVHAQQNIFGAHEKAIELYEKFSTGGVMPPYLSRYFLCNSGSEAVENAVKIARSYTGRPHIIAFDGGFHGRTMGAMALTSSKTVYRQGFAPLMPGVFIAPYPYCLHCKVQEMRGHPGYHVAPYVPPFDQPQNRECCNAPSEALEWMLKMQTAPSETAAVIIEPILGEGGFLTPPPGFLAGLRKLCDKHNILLIADEVQAGVARTGKWWGFQQFDDGAMKPDVLIFAKGIASGYPLAGVAGRDELFKNLIPGTLGGTYGGNAVACAAAVATLDVIEKEHLMNNARERGLQLMQGLTALAKKYPGIIDIRGRGLMVGVELGAVDGGRSARKGIAMEVTKACAQHHMLLMTAGPRESIRFLPPLTVTHEEVDMALDIFGKAVEGVLKDEPPGLLKTAKKFVPEVVTQLVS